MLRNRLYYRLKPFIPQSFRTAVRRRIAFRLLDRIGSVWPIAPGSERRPEGWPGWPENKKFALVLTHDVENAAGLRKCRASCSSKSMWDLFRCESAVRRRLSVHDTAKTGPVLRWCQEGSGEG
jgi:hypothetical protein